MKHELFGVKIDALRMNEAVDRLMEWTKPDQPMDCKFVVTPNVDHTVILRENEQLQDAYKDAAMVLADGHPVVLASKLLGRPLPERVPGSELVPRMFDRVDADNQRTVFLLGAGPGVADRAAEKMAIKWQYLKTVGTYCPPLGFQEDDAECEKILKMINDVQPDILVVGLGAPKQELWVHRFQSQLETKVAFCVGATIDFLAGEKQRAPQWIQNIGMEWCHRMCSEPKRLVKRYAKDAWIFPQIVFQQWRSQKKKPAENC